MGCAEGLVKTIVFIVNLVFALAGIALIVVGVLQKLDITDYQKAIPEDYQNIGLASTLTIAIGSVIFVIAFFGCCGAIRESPCLLTTYAVILFVIFLLQVAIGVFAFIEIKNKDNLETEVEKSLKVIFNKYYVDKTNASKEIVDLLQSELECCGLTGPNSWTAIGPIPESCVEKDNNKYFEDGCIDEFVDFLHNSAQIIGITVLAISATEVIGAIFSLCLANTIKNRERRFRY